MLEFTKIGNAGSLNGLNDIICVEGDCLIGQTLVNQMSAFYQNALTTASNPDDFSTHFKSSVDSIVSSFNDANGSFWRHFPFSPTCCSIKEIGNQAQSLTQSMSQFLGVAAPSQVDTKGITADIPNPLSGIASLGTLVTVIAWVGGLGIALYIGNKVYRSFNEPY